MNYKRYNDEIETEINLSVYLNVYIYKKKNHKKKKERRIKRINTMNDEWAG